MVVWWYGAHIDRCHIALLYNIYIDAIRTRYGVSDAATQPRANSSDSTHRYHPFTLSGRPVRTPANDSGVLVQHV